MFHMFTEAAGAWREIPKYALQIVDISYQGTAEDSGRGKRKKSRHFTCTLRSLLIGKICNTHLGETTLLGPFIFNKRRIKVYH